MTENSDEPVWEYDERRGEIADKVLQPGETLVWYEVDTRLHPTHLLRKELRRGHGTVTFFVLDEKEDKVKTVGTYYPNYGRTDELKK